MQLLYPIGLLALAGLIIPVIVHLWNIKKGKTLKIGSIVLLGESAKASSKSWHIKDWLLFVLRCILLILIALLLARPYFKEIAGTKKQSGWVLMEKEQLKKLHQSEKQTIDSLLTLGFELHEFNLDFKPMTWKDTATAVEKRSLSYSSLLKQLNSQLPAHFSVYLFAKHQLNSFDGAMPLIAFNLKWKTPLLIDTLKKWTSNFAGKNYEASSSPSLTTYKAIETQTNMPAIEVLLYEPNGTDQKYIKAALNAIADFTGRKIEIKSWNEALDTQATVGFWLSDEPIDQKHLSKLKKDANLFTYAKGKKNTLSTTLNLSDKASVNYSPIELYQSISAVPLTSQMVWSDGFGHPILTKETNGNYHQYRFYSKFNPKWTDLVWSEQLVKALMPIIYADQDAIDFGFEDHPADQRQIAAQQQFMQINTAGVVAKNSTLTPLDQFFWLLTFLVLIVERILSFSKQTKLQHVKG